MIIGLVLWNNTMDMEFVAFCILSNSNVKQQKYFELQCNYCMLASQKVLDFE